MKSEAQWLAERPALDDVPAQLAWLRAIRTEVLCAALDAVATQGPDGTAIMCWGAVSKLTEEVWPTSPAPSREPA